MPVSTEAGQTREWMEMTVPEVALDKAWEMLEGDANAVLLDVRTQAEWNFVGVPDLASIGRDVQLAEWISYPGGQPNPDFLAQATNGLDKSTPVLVICRSGARSAAAVQALHANGYENAINVGPGFEGDLDGHGHRHGGWKDVLPWRQS